MMHMTTVSDRYYNMCETLCTHVPYYCDSMTPEQRFNLTIVSCFLTAATVCNWSEGVAPGATDLSCSGRAALAVLKLLIAQVFYQPPEFNIPEYHLNGSRCKAPGTHTNRKLISSPVARQ